MSDAAASPTVAFPFIVVAPVTVSVPVIAAFPPMFALPATPSPPSIVTAPVVLEEETVVPLNDTTEALVELPTFIVVAPEPNVIVVGVAKRLNVAVELLTEAPLMLTLLENVAIPVTPNVPEAEVFPVLLSMVNVEVAPSSALTITSDLNVEASVPASPKVTSPLNIVVPVTVRVPRMLVVDPDLLILITLEAPPKFIVPVEVLMRLKFATDEVKSPPFTPKSPVTTVFALLMVSIPVAAPILIVVAAPPILRVVATVLKTFAVVTPVLAII